MDVMKVQSFNASWLICENDLGISSTQQEDGDDD